MPNLDRADWYAIEIPAATEYVDVLRAMALCQRSMLIRDKSEVGGQLVEIMATTPQEAADREVVFRQILTDQILRRQIAQKADTTIGGIADAILYKAGAC
ncbi:hypothetical protein QWZ03_07945 [Chitinimonas viridis]|uniref:His-Xaa-Ser system protein HxsD n=1 Tax=Chitinimonas viridis TaxID=664880 RepID=A0ABT8B366_9NEIS|nr:hypothetical protein [Chitinimonas viridis]MDN3576692.1 hypothetical protein [Chitinimonas viridis]